MNRLVTAVIAAAFAAGIALAIVWLVTFVRGTSFATAISQPSFWLVEGVAIVLAVFATLSRPSGTAEGDGKSTSLVGRVAWNAAWTAAGAVLIGVLLAIVTDTDIVAVLTSLKFLIPAGIAVAIAVFEALPSDVPTEDR